jgi:hypothetical protein
VGTDIGIFNCFTASGHEVQYFPTFDNLIQNFNQSFSQIDVCENYQPLTPYDGGYSLNSQADENGLPTYSHANNYIVQQNNPNLWSFSDPSNTLGKK